MRLSPPIPQPKPQPAAKDRGWQAADRKGSAEVKWRSNGQCEVVVDGRTPFSRCHRRAVHVHHMLSGWRIRGRGESAKAIRKQATCVSCHEDIERNRLKRIGGRMPHWQDCYERVG